MKKTIFIFALIAIASCCMAQNEDSVLYQKAASLYKSNDYSQAYPLFKQLAEKGYADAQFALGHYFFFGLISQTIDKAEALKWYDMAAQNGQPDAQWFMGAFYRDGVVVDTNYSKAFEYLKKSALANCIDAIIDLGLMYENGQYVSRSPLKAKDYYMQAITKANDPRAMLCMGNLYRYYGEDLGCEEKCMDQAIIWYNQSAEQGYAKSQVALANLYEWDWAIGSSGITIYGDYVKKDGIITDVFYKDTVLPYVENLFRLAAENGSGEAQAVMGFMNFITKDYDVAMQWYKKAQENGAKNVFRYPNINLPIDMAVTLCEYFSNHNESNFYCVYRESLFGGFDGWTIFVYPSDSSNFHWYTKNDCIYVTVEKNGKFGLVKLSKDGKLMGKTPVIYDGGQDGCFNYDETTGQFTGSINSLETNFSF